MAPVAPRRRRRADLLAIGFVIVAVGVAMYALRGELPAVGDALARVGWWRVAVALVLVVLGLLATAEVWRQCLASLGSVVSPPAARRIFFPAQVGKYLPGAVWPFLAQMRLAREHGVAASLALLSGAVFLAVHTVTSVLVAALILISEPALVGRFGWVALFAPLSIALLHPRVVGAVARRLAARAGVEQPELAWSKLVRPVAWMLPAWLCYGAAGYLLAEPFGGMSARLATLCAGAFALGWLVGLVVFVAPAGVGAREAVLVLVLVPSLGVTAATAVSLLLRVCHTLADVLLALRYGLVRSYQGERTRHDA